MKHLTGKRIRLISMYGDPDPIPPGATGTVHSVIEFQNSYHLNMTWDKGVKRSLNLICPPDKVEVISIE